MIPVCVYVCMCIYFLKKDSIWQNREKTYIK